MLTFPRALIMALLISALLNLWANTTAEDQLGYSALAVLVAWALWHLVPDPLPEAIRKGLDAYAKDYRRER